ncbi:hypothetical protein CC78DRAFT_594620 [Lojkania enalia]|uniref:Clr5 domain-containing protein n=1 Tax=Lojkania enalia TaxID=147567 RepID=A0A9P4KDY9_9PLEO|nr:hypothetical protein CC78DRAFT_594620 [Didymosphaeria enalia]
MDRWEELKPIVEKLYLLEKKRLADVVLILKNDYGFDAVKGQWKKNIPKSKKDKIAEQIESRARAGRRGTSITFQGRTVEPHKIRRHMKMKARTDSQDLVLKKPSNIESVITGSVLLFANSIFLKWNMPYAAMRRSHARPFDHTSLLGLSVPTPGTDISVTTPSSASSPRNAPSPTTLFLKGRAAIDRAHLFAQGQHDKLLMSMDGEERRVMSEWLYQYWFFCFKTAKNWEIQEEVSRDPIEQDPNDESTWLPWPKDWQEPPLPTRLRGALEHNDFSTISAATLPVAIPQIAKAAQRSPGELLLESLGFSIMSRNLTQVTSTIHQLKCENIDFTSLYPLHMATSYLDGYKTCCDIFSELLECGLGTILREMLVNELGHTILDNLMISILKSHSSTTPVVVDDTLKDTARFIGEEIDICSRWDADSLCVRHLLAKGNPSTPFAWKHKFCHTSIQTICHCIIRMYNWGPGCLMGTASGLYVRRCFDCGMKLQLQPLHSLVMTAYHLASSGCQDEDLSGMLACLLCLISCGLDPRETASVSVIAFVQTDAPEIRCDHEDLTPAKLAEKISTYPTVSSWSAKARSGWVVFCGVLRLCEDIDSELEGEWDDVSMENGQDCDINSLVCYFRARRDLATLWASVQAELLTYRRLDDGMDWVSQNFSMEELRSQLDRGESLSVGYVKQDLLQPHRICGNFNCFSLATQPDATTPDIANLDIWERATYGVLDDD